MTDIRDDLIEKVRVMIDEKMVPHASVSHSAEQDERVLDELARDLVAVFEEAHAPSDDEREALARLIDPEAWRDVQPHSAAFYDDAKAQETYEGFFWDSVRERREPSLAAADRVISSHRTVQGESCSCRGEYVTALDIVDGCRCGRVKPYDQMSDDECDETAAAPSDDDRAFANALRADAAHLRYVMKGKETDASARLDRAADLIEDEAIAAALEGTPSPGWNWPDMGDWYFPPDERDALKRPDFIERLEEWATDRPNGREEESNACLSDPRA